MKSTQYLFVGLLLALSFGLNAQTITFEENSSEFNNRTLILTPDGQENGRNRYANRSSGDVFVNVVVRWDGNRWIITDGNDGGNDFDPGVTFIVYANNYDVGPNPPSFDQGNWEVVFAGEELVRFEGDGTQEFAFDWNLTAGPFSTTDGVQTGLGGALPTGGIYTGEGVTDDGNGMTFTFDPEAAGPGLASVSYGADNKVIVQTITVTQGGPSVNFANSTGSAGELAFAGVVNGRNSFSGEITNSPESVSIAWSGARWEIAASVSGVVFVSNYDVGPNAPDLATGNWQSLFPDIVSLTQLDGEGTQTVTLAFTLDNTSFTTDDGVQTGLGGGTPTGGVYSGPGVTDDGNGMTFSFDPATAGGGMITISYGDGPDGANNVAQTVEVTEPADQIIFETTNVDGNLFSSTLTQGELVNSRNSYEGTADQNDETVAVRWSGTRWEIFAGSGGNILLFSSSYDVGLNPPDLVSGNWRIEIPQVTSSFDRFEGSGTQAVNLAFTLDNTSFTTDDGVQTGLGGGTPAGGVYSGPGVTDDGNGMTFSFDPTAAGSGMITISYGDGPDGANNVTQTVEVIDLSEVCLQEAFDGIVPSIESIVNGQNFTACTTGRVISIDVDVLTASNTVTLKLNKGIDTEGEDYSQEVSFTETGRVRIELTEPFIVVQDSVYAFSLTDETNVFDSQGNSSDLFAEGNFFNENGQFAGIDLNFALITEIDSTAVSVRPGLDETVTTLTAFPNPTNGNFTVAYDLLRASDVTIVLYDAQGRKLRELPQGVQTGGAQRAAVTRDGLAAGVVYYGLITERGHSRVLPIMIR